MNCWSPQGFEYGRIEFEDGRSTWSSPGAKFVENLKKRATAIYQKKRCYSGSRHLPRITILRPRCAIYRRYLIICLRHLINTEDIEEYQEEKVMSINKHKQKKTSQNTVNTGPPQRYTLLKKRRFTSKILGFMMNKNVG